MEYVDGVSDGVDAVKQWRGGEVWTIIGQYGLCKQIFHIEFVC